MATYLVLKPIGVTTADGRARSYRAGIVVDLDDADDLLAQGRIEPVEATEPAVELADEPADGEKSLASHTIPELVEIAKANGASEDSVKHLSKPKLIEAVERLTHVVDD
jgi:hypothetical protein